MKETFANAICMDKIDCSEVTQSMCKEFSFIERDCPATCRICVCRDQKDCSGVTPNFCNLYPQIKDICPKTCGICCGRDGKHRITSIISKLTQLNKLYL